VKAAAVCGELLQSQRRRSKSSASHRRSVATSPQSIQAKNRSQEVHLELIEVIGLFRGQQCRLCTLLASPYCTPCLRDCRRLFSRQSFLGVLEYVNKYAAAVRSSWRPNVELQPHYQSTCTTSTINISGVIPHLTCTCHTQGSVPPLHCSRGNSMRIYRQQLRTPS
jgi:hypothetical protein